MEGQDSVDRMRFYVFTFGLAHPLHDMLQGVYATSEQKAREIMRDFYGTRPWCSCYEVREPTNEEMSGEAEVSLFGYRYHLIRHILKEGDEYK